MLHVLLHVTTSVEWLGYSVICYVTNSVAVHVTAATTELLAL